MNYKKYYNIVKKYVNLAYVYTGTFSDGASLRGPGQNKCWVL
jgi:hypothetical protein